MKNLRLSEVSGVRRSARTDLEPPERMENFENGHVASPGLWDADIYFVFGWFVQKQSSVGFGLVLFPFFISMDSCLSSPLDLLY